MDAGDGRNQALFNYILTLTSNDFSVDDTRECIRILNRFVLKEPLSDDELEVILRVKHFKNLYSFVIRHSCLTVLQHGLRTMKM